MNPPILSPPPKPRRAKSNPNTPSKPTSPTSPKSPTSPTSSTSPTSPQSSSSSSNLPQVPLGLSEINAMLVKFGWVRHDAQFNEWIYRKDLKTADEFRIRLTDHFIVLALPIRNSDMLFATKVTSYFRATELVEQHLLNYEKAEQIPKTPTLRQTKQPQTSKL